MEQLGFTYNWPIVIISVLIAVFASFTTIELIRKTMTSDQYKMFWLVVSSVTMGFGIWSMHFTGMLALMTDVSLEYDVITTFASLVFAILASCLAFYLIIYKSASQKVVWISSIILGVGIASMHYTGMQGLTVVNVNLGYEMIWVIASILLGIIGSYLALIILTKVNDDYLFVYQFPIACLLGLAISSMHYTAMEAVSIYQSAEESVYFYQIWTISANSNYLFLILVLVTAFLFIILNTIMLRERIIQRQLSYMAFHDSLTGLPNRYMLNEFLNKQLLNSEREGRSFAVLFLDLNDFKKVNDDYGHDTGDQILKMVAKRLSENIQGDNIVARLGGDEFIIVLSKAGCEEANQMIECITKQFEKEFYLNNQAFLVSPSIGTSLYPQDGKSIDTLIRKADHAMYDKKHMKGVLT